MAEITQSVPRPLIGQCPSPTFPPSHHHHHNNNKTKNTATIKRRKIMQPLSLSKKNHTTSKKNYNHATSQKLYQSYYPHRLKDSVSPVCGIFFNYFLELLGTHTHSSLPLSLNHILESAKCFKNEGMANLNVTIYNGTSA